MLVSKASKPQKQKRDQLYFLDVLKAPLTQIGWRHEGGAGSIELEQEWSEVENVYFGMVPVDLDSALH